MLDEKLEYRPDGWQKEYASWPELVCVFKEFGRVPFTEKSVREYKNLTERFANRHVPESTYAFWHFSKWCFTVCVAPALMLMKLPKLIIDKRLTKMHGNIYEEDEVVNTRVLLGVSYTLSLLVAFVGITTGKDNPNKLQYWISAAYLTILLVCMYLVLSSRYFLSDEEKWKRESIVFSPQNCKQLISGAKTSQIEFLHELNRKVPNARFSLETISTGHIVHYLVTVRDSDQLFPPLTIARWKQMEAIDDM